MAKINRCGLKYFVLKMNGKDKQLFEEISRLKINNKEKNIVHKN